MMISLKNMKVVFATYILCLLCTPLMAKDNVPLKKVKHVQDLVWKEWCEQLKVTDSLEHLSLEQLNGEKVVKWDIPSKLEANAVMPFYSGVKGESPKGGFPMFVYLHGSGPKEAEWATGLKLAQLFDDSPSAYVIPQIPNEGELYRWWQKGKQWVWDHLFRQMLSNTMIDPARIYLFGISEGGYGSQRLASFYADYLAGAGPMAGGEPLRNAPAENLCHTAFSLVTGELDNMFYRNELTQRTMERLDSLQKESPDEYHHRVMLEPGKGHAITYSVTTPWLKTYNREAQPKHFRWENFEMDGQKRNAFYNLEVIDEYGDGRADYEFTVSDNIIRLNVRKVEYIITKTDPRWGIELDNTRRYTNAEHGKVRIFLSESLVDLSRPVVVELNGHKIKKQKLKASKSCMQQSCALYGDPLRIFPASIEVEW